MMVMISRHRRCGCDCRDSDTYHPDDAVFNPLFATGCAGGKPPCKMVARFECDIRNDLNQAEFLFERSIPLRQICEFNATLGQYFGLMFGAEGAGSGTFNSAEAGSQYPYSCTWAARFGVTAHPESLAGYIRWTLNTVGVVTFTHTTGIQYAMPAGVAWDCFGPNTLLVVLSSIPAWVTSYPTFVCITPEIERFQSQTGCCDNCFETSLPVIEAGDAYLMAQRLEFMPVADNAPDYLPGYACQYKAFVKLYGMHQSTGGFDPDALCYTGYELPGRFSDSLSYSRLLIQTSTDIGPSRAFVRISYLRHCSGSQTSNIPIVVIYETDRFACDGGTFNRTTNDPEFPQTITITSRACYYEEVNDWGPVPNGRCTGQILEPDRPSYPDETKRYRCCDPWGSCAPGRIKIYCPSRGTQDTGACMPFCTGGRTGINSPNGPSRQYCTSVTDSSGTSHDLCVVVYCGEAGAWFTDWYCDNVYQGQGGGGTVTCCPHTVTHQAPEMACMSGCTGCFGLNIDPTCSPQPPCCDPATFPSTFTVAVTSSLFGSFSVTLNHVGTVWQNDQTTGTTAPSGDVVFMIFDPVACTFSVSCADIFNYFVFSIGGALQHVFTVVSCTPPTFSASTHGSLFHSYCGGGGSDDSAFVIS